MASKGVAYSLASMMILLVAAGGYGLAVKPKLEDAEELKSAIAVETQYRDVMVDLQHRAEAVTADFSAITDEAQHFNASFPSASDQAGLLSSLNDAASKSGIEISNITPGTAQSLEQITQEVQDRLEADPETEGQNADGDPRYTYMSVNVTLKGGEKKQRSFLQALEDMDRKLYIQNVASGLGENSTGDLNVTLIAMITAPLEDPTAEDPDEKNPSDDTASQGEGPEDQ